MIGWCYTTNLTQQKTSTCGLRVEVEWFAPKRSLRQHYPDQVKRFAAALWRISVWLAQTPVKVVCGCFGIQSRIIGGEHGRGKLLCNQ
jgi:hypothetical protein